MSVIIFFSSSAASLPDISDKSRIVEPFSLYPKKILAALTAFAFGVGNKALMNFRISFSERIYSNGL